MNRDKLLEKIANMKLDVIYSGTYGSSRKIAFRISEHINCNGEIDGYFWIRAKPEGVEFQLPDFSSTLRHCKINLLETFGFASIEIKDALKEVE